RLARIMGAITAHGRDSVIWTRPTMSDVPAELLEDAIDAVLWEPVMCELSDTPEGWAYSSIHRRERRLAS
ncbi:MAG: hypothetical protein ACU0CI_07435, partial [Shimia sp.]